MPKIVKGYQYRELFIVTVPIAVSGLVMAICAAWLRERIGFVLTIPVAAVVYSAMLVATRSVTLQHLTDARSFFAKKSGYALPPSPDA